MTAVAHDRVLDVIREKVEDGERLDLEDGLALLESDDLLAVGELADLARRVRGGDDRVFFIQNLYLNQTNVCRVKCKFCAFAATQKQVHAYTLSPDEFVAGAVAQHEVDPFTEIHMVNGENPHIGFDFYLDTIGGCATLFRDVHSEVLHGLRDSPHDDAVGAPRTRPKVAQSCRPWASGSSFRAAARRSSPTASGAWSCPGKEHPDIWFGVHDTAHRLGIPTHCTMLYGHVETYEERIEHLLRLRDQQDRTGGFLAFIPLAFHPENTVFERRGFSFQTGAADLKMLAVSRLLLDNIPNIKAYWISLTMPVAQVALHLGANDVQGTVVREEIFRAAGGRTGTEAALEQLRCEQCARSRARAGRA